MIGAGAIIIGPVAIGDNCMIGAHTLVSKDVQSDSVAYGSPLTLHMGKGKQIVDEYLKVEF